MEGPLVGRGDGYRIFAVSDGTGGTSELATRAALAQFQTVGVEIRRVPNVRTLSDVRRVVQAAQRSGAIVVHTLVSKLLRQAVLREARRRDVVSIDLIGPLLSGLSSVLRRPALNEPGLYRLLPKDHFPWIDVIEYTVKHDDGHDPLGLDRADIVLVGVSRASKTPLSIYLARNGWRVANVPVILDLPLPGPLMRIDQGRVVGLILGPERLVQLRRARLQGSDAPLSAGYADPEHVRSEVRYSRSLFRRAGWPVIDVTDKSIEEAADEVLAVVTAFQGPPSMPGERAPGRR